MDSFGLSGVDANYTDFLKRSASASSALNSIKNTKDGDADDEKMMNACKEFEAYLLEMVMKEVTKSTNLFGLDSDSSSGAMSLIADNAKDTMIQTAASKLTEGGELGIAQKLYDAMKQQASMKTWDEIQAEKKAEDSQGESFSPNAERSVSPAFAGTTAEAAAEATGNPEIEEE